MKRIAYGSVLLLLPVLIVPFSCRPAGLEYIGAKKRADQSNETKPDEQTSAANPNDPNNPINPINPHGQGNGGVGIDANGNGPPVAGVEIMRNGVPTNQSIVNEGVTIRPTVETIDADDKSMTGCINAGITKVDYDFGDGGKQSFERLKPCDPLDVPHIYVAVGTFTVTMIVHTAENETAQASVQLVVGTPGIPNTIGVPGQIPGQRPGQLPGQRPPTQAPRILGW